MCKRKRILTGDRPTGPLHLGHYIGSLRNRVRLQYQYETFIIIADLHTLTTHPRKKDLAHLNEHIHELVLDYLAAGIDPRQVAIFLQSAIPETAELALLLSMLTPVPRLERIPSLHEMASASRLPQLSLGLLGYPVLMAADILLPRAHLVPVGSDNQAHVELARELARRFNHMYGATFPLPELLLGDETTLIGTDGKGKMSKSLGNAICLRDDPTTVEEKVMHMYTDPARVHASIPGTVEGNPVFAYHDAFNPNQEEVQDLKNRYRHGLVGDVEVKRKLVRALNTFLDPFRERRHHFAAEDGLVEQIVTDGTARVRIQARQTLAIVRANMGLTGHTFQLASSSNNTSIRLEGKPLAMI